MEVLLILPVIIPILAGALLPLFTKNQGRGRLFYVAFVLFLNCALVLMLIFTGQSELRTLFVNNVINIYLNFDELSMFFVLLASAIWLLVAFFTFGGSLGTKNNARFYGFFLATYGAVLGAFLAGNFFTLYLFYELITLLTYPLVIHFGTQTAKKAGAKYLIYSFIGASLILVGFIFTANFGYTTDFVAGGTISAYALAEHYNLIILVFFLTFIGFGVKAYIWPLFDWVPESYPQAPAPVAALLSGIASKVAVLAIIRVSHYVFNWEIISGSWAQMVLMFMILPTIFIGSMLAYKEKLFARRLAYSSVSQLSYILFGLIILMPLGFLGAMLHILFHAIIKTLLFLSNGAILHKTGKSHVPELRGIGKSMPITMWCFTAAAVALVGIPPTGGFVSKWYLAMGSLSAGLGGIGILGVAILLVSSLLTAGYLITIFSSAFFPGSKFDYKTVKKLDPIKTMTIPMIILASLALVLGMFPSGIMDYINGIVYVIFMRGAL